LKNKRAGSYEADNGGAAASLDANCDRAEKIEALCVQFVLVETAVAVLWPALNEKLEGFV
jgi:hypothetical protein